MPNDPAATLHTQRTLPATPGQIYAALADPAQLAAWWGPNGFRNEFETFDFRPGGDWTFVMVGPDGKRYPNECRFLELVPGERAVIHHLCAPRFRLSIELAPAAGGGTRLAWTQAFEDPAVAAAVRHIAEPGNEQNLDRLTALLRTRAQAAG